MFQRYQQHCATPSDIQHHLPLLYSLARGNVLELGTRTGVSTVALLAGVETKGGHVWSVDVDDCSRVAGNHPQWTFIQGDSRDPDLAERIAAWDRNNEGKPTAMILFDLILIDTFHAYEVTQAELTLWHSRLAPGGTICMHDPETFPGVRRAAQEFADSHGWPITFVLPNNGMAIIERPITGVSTEGASWAMEGKRGC